MPLRNDSGNKKKKKEKGRKRDIVEVVGQPGGDYFCSEITD